MVSFLLSIAHSSLLPKNIYDKNRQDWFTDQTVQVTLMVKTGLVDVVNQSMIYLTFLSVCSSLSLMSILPECLIKCVPVYHYLWAYISNSSLTLISRN